MKIVVTYFEPFGGRSFNASKATACGLSINAKIVGLPVSWDNISSCLDEIFIDEPDYLFLIGEASKIPFPRLELEAHNLMIGKDNYGVDKNKEEIIESALPTLNTTFITDEQFILSYDAGTYLCNCSFYLSLAKSKNAKVIFIHVPAFNNEDEEKKKETVATVESMINHLIKIN